jgi:hypothetical protein
MTGFIVLVATETDALVLFCACVGLLIIAALMSAPNRVLHLLICE